MALRIEDYGLIGDRQTTALIGRDGSIDFMCLPRFDSDACFAALLGTRENGRWLIAPADPVARTHRYYRDDTLVLETEMTTSAGRVRLTDCMVPHPHDTSRLVRQVTGLDGEVDMQLELVFRFGFGKIIPWVQRLPHGEGLVAVAGPDMVVIWSDVPLEGRNRHTEAKFTVKAGETVTFSMAWLQSHHRIPHAFDAEHGIALAAERSQKWVGRVPAKNHWVDVIKRSLITLKALTHWETGGIIAAATTSLPEELGGERNWDYRYCWLRDASFTLQAFLAAGYRDEASAWRHWLDRAVAGNAADIQIMYGVAGERRLAEWEVDWLGGYEGSKPVRIGNAAAGQTQLDVYGELLDTLYQAHKGGLLHDENSWSVRVNLLEQLETIWSLPDEGIWEVRGGRQQFVHSKVMAWVAFDRAVRSVEEFGYDGPADRWRVIRDTIHAQVCTEGYDAALGSFVQAYGSKLLDASLLLLPVVGFLPPTDHRIIGTVAAIERDLMQDGFVRRYNTAGGKDGLSGTEGVFLACSFWLVDNYTMMGRRHDAETLFEKLIALRNDLGLFSEEYDTINRRMIGNFPQAFTHVALVNSALRLSAG
ncbi:MULTISPECIES: glycoside hydrolase family 15 protein [Acidiphilium]|uniref:Trehalase n=1 Tax=Acidiphilium rubrum TaxID=526 RepID=A0A8G2CM31_ACIRU|nr:MULTISPECIES: glycoside hydrolase family 15 protein [Acidiphilium]SIR15535.1 Glucoamylase (glucan-1,4-alpha-glucosidase), GH15 family [Acidiphilium rubrum]